MRTALLLVAFSAAALSAQDKSKPWYAMDYGPCLSTTIEGFTPDNVALKARAIFLGDDAGVVFDTELLRVAAAWTDGYLELRGTPFDGAHGPSPRVRGDEVCSTPQAPGWATDGWSYADPRPIPHGPLPDQHGRFLGHAFHGDEVVLRYAVLGREVLELFEAMRDDAGRAYGIERTLEVGPGPEVRTLLAQVRDPEPYVSEVERAGMVALGWHPPAADGAGRGPRRVTGVHIESVDVAAKLVSKDGRIELVVPPADGWCRVKLSMATADGAVEMTIVSDLVRKPSELLGGGPRRYPETLTTKGELGDGDGPFVVDTVTVPDRNPWHSRLRFGAFDFVDADTVALSTWNGDVWLVDGVDGDLDELTWSRFCTGLHDPLGLKVVDGTIYTHGRDGIYELHDLNGDGECDFVETFNNDVLITKGFHEFAFDLQTDAAGNFYFSKAGPVNPGGRGFQEIVPHHGTVMKVSKDGSTLEVVATGVRAPNGIGVSPDGIVTSGDNQGTWTPACRLNTTQNGTFWGCVDVSHREPPPTAYDEPICWLPMSVDNSGGGQVRVPDDAWGPLGGMLVHQSYGQCSDYLVLQQQDAATGHVQGGVVRIPADFASSQMRGRFRGGDLYTVGFKGWQTRAAKDTAFQRVRRTAAPLRMPIGMRVFERGIELAFSDALDPEVANDPDSYEVEIWNYAWTEAYGSPELKPSDPEKKVREGEKNRDVLTVTAAELAGDGRTVFLTVDGMRTAMQTRIAYSVDSADGGIVEGEIHGTIHFLPKR